MISAILLLSYQLILFKNYLSIIYFLKGENSWKFFESLKANLVGKNARIVLPEGEEPRILQATKRLVKETEVIPVLLGTLKN